MKLLNLKNVISLNSPLLFQYGYLFYDIVTENQIYKTQLKKIQYFIVSLINYFNTD